MRGQWGFFDVDDRLKRLSDLGDQLEAFRAALRHSVDDLVGAGDALPPKADINCWPTQTGRKAGDRHSIRC
jgi:hypothetical protein